MKYLLTHIGQNTVTNTLFDDAHIAIKAFRDTSAEKGFSTPPRELIVRFLETPMAWMRTFNKKQAAYQVILAKLPDQS